MARLTLYMITLALGAAAAVALVSCGGSDDELLPGDDASQILSNLEEVEARVADGDCEGAVSAAQEVRAQVEELPRSVDPELRERLEEGAVRLEEVASTDCDVPTTTVTETEPTETEPTETTDEDEDGEDEETDTGDTEPTEPTETVPTETEPTETEPTTPTNGDSGGISPGGSSGFQPGGD